ncbi:MAG: hypothetical protein O7D94_08480, partial [Planctomycetota bacterium]|nr:hypothetical protein [Planctomycetota bacterium]
MVQNVTRQGDSGSSVPPRAQGPEHGTSRGGGSLTDNESGRWLARQERSCTIAFLVFWAAWTGVLAYTWTRFPDLHHGDYLSDGNVLHSGINYDAHGLRENWGLPSYLDVGASGEKPRFDTHYPALPYWLLQVCKAAGCESLSSFRAVAVGVSAVASLLGMILMTLLTRSRLIGALSGFFYMYNCAFAGYADALHQFAYGQLALFAVLLFWIGYERGSSPGRRGLALAMAAVFFFIDGWITFEHMAFVPIFAAGRWFWLRQRRLLTGCIVIGLVPVAVLASRVSHNAMALGGFEQAIGDFRNAASYRGGHSDEDLTWSKVADTWH